MNIISNDFLNREQFNKPSNFEKSKRNRVIHFLGKKNKDEFTISSFSGSENRKLKTKINSKEGNLFIISGPSGTGKGTIVSNILETVPDIVLSVSATTRNPRPNEKDSVQYHFIDQEKFQKLVKENHFLEWAEVYEGQYYGTLKDPIAVAIKSGKDLILEIGADTHDFIKQQLPKAISIFIAPPSFEELSRRLIDRKTETKEKIEERLKRAKEELKFQNKFDFVVINSNLNKAIQEVKNIILKARKTKQEKTTPKTYDISA